MKKNVTCISIVAAAVVLLLASCATTPKFDQEKFDFAYENGDYALCAQMMNGKKDKHDAVKNSIDANMLRFHSDDYLASGRGFLETKKLFQQVTESTAPSKVIQAALTGEYNVEYSGSVYERIASYSMRAIDSIKLGDMDNALGVMKDYSDTYKEIVNSVILQQREIEAETEKLTQDDKRKKAVNIFNKAGINVSNAGSGAPEKYASQYETSPLMSYLGTIVYAANDDFDHAKDFSSVLKTDNSSVNVEDVLSVPSDKGRLEILSLSGTIGQRTEYSTDLIPVGIVEGVPVMFKFTYPQFKGAKHNIDSVEVSLSNGDSKSAVIVENFDAAVLDDVKSKQLSAFNRSVTRNIIKNSSAIATVVTSKILMNEAPNNMIRTGAEITYNSAIIALPLAMPLIIDAEKADIRQAKYLPHLASAAGFTVDPGKYTVTVKYMNKGSIVAEEVIENVEVKAGKVSVSVSACAK